MPEDAVTDDEEAEPQPALKFRNHTRRLSEGLPSRPTREHLAFQRMKTLGKFGWLSRRNLLTLDQNQATKNNWLARRQ
jgi:hypothetical protein